MTKFEFIQDISQGLTNIQYHLPWTEFEKKQINAGEKSIRLSKGHLLFPFLSKRNIKNNIDTTQLDRSKAKSHTYPRRWKFFQMQLKMLVIINRNPNGNFLTDKNLLKGCVQFFIMNYVGNYDYIMEDFKIVSIELREILKIIDKSQYYGLVYLARKVYPSCFVGKEPRFTCVEYFMNRGKEADNKTEKDHPDQNPTERKCDISRKARTRKRVEIIARSIFDIDTPTFDTYVTSQGYFTKQFMDDTNAKMVKYGFKPLKEAGFRALIEESLSVLGITREDLVFNECGFYTNKSSDPVMLFRLFPDNKCA